MIVRLILALLLLPIGFVAVYRAVKDYVTGYWHWQGCVERLNSLRNDF